MSNKLFGVFPLFIVGIILLCLYAYPNTPKLSIEEFSVPAFNKTSDHTAGNIYFDLKLRNMNKAIGLYYDGPLSLAFSYYPLEEPYQKYVWVGTVPSFYQGNGKTKHIKALRGNTPQVSSKVAVVVVDGEDDAHEVVESNNVRALLRDQYLQLPSTLAGDEDVKETSQDVVVVEKSDPAPAVVNFRVDLAVKYRFKYWFGAATHQLELGGDVLVDAKTGERVSTGSVKLVESDAAAGAQVMLMVLFTSFLLNMCF